MLLSSGTLAGSTVTSGPELNAPESRENFFSNSDHVESAEVASVSDPSPKFPDHTDLNYEQETVFLKGKPLPNHGFSNGC